MLSAFMYRAIFFPIYMSLKCSRERRRKQYFEYIGPQKKITIMQETKNNQSNDAVQSLSFKSLVSLWISDCETILSFSWAITLSRGYVHLRSSPAVCIEKNPCRDSSFKKFYSTFWIKKKTDSYLKRIFRGKYLTYIAWKMSLEEKKLKSYTSPGSFWAQISHIFVDC